MHLSLGHFDYTNLILVLDSKAKDIKVTELAQFMNKKYSKEYITYNCDLRDCLNSFLNFKSIVLLFWLVVTHYILFTKERFSLDLSTS